MDFDSDKVRALSKSLQNLSSTIEPTPRKHRRKKHATAKQTFVTTAVVPAPDSTEILSSLISSLTVLSDSTRDQVHEVTSLQESIESTQYRDLPDEPFTSNQPASQGQNEMLVEGPARDNDTAEFPVVGYARGRSKTPTKSKEKWTIHRAGHDRSISAQRQPTSLVHRSLGSGASIGIPSIERPSTSATNRSSKENSPPFDQMKMNPVKTCFSSRPSEDLRGFTMSHKDEESSVLKISRSRKNSTVTTRSRQNSSVRKDIKDSRPPISRVLTSPKQWPQPSPEAGTGPGATRHNPLSPANREDLGEHLIPSRSSSLRHSPDKSRRRRPSATRQTSNDSEVKAPIVEAASAEEEDSTRRRIRELQMAKERRQTEWAAESKRAEQKTKQLQLAESERQETLPRSITQPALGSSTEQGARLPLSATMIDLSRTKTTTPVGRVAYLPAILPATPTSPSISLLGTTGGQVTAWPSPGMHKRGFSASIRRSSSIRKQTSEEVKKVSEQVDSFLNAPCLSRRIQHPRNRRTITFSEVGDPDGFVVFVCVGMGLTRYITSFYDEVARMEKLRLITPDRPGIGGTSPFPDGSTAPLAWVDDVAVICQSLNIGRFSLLAHSAGAIHALAIALKMPQYVCGKIQLLAPWIPASQMSAKGAKEMRTANLPRAHRLLSMLPAPFLRAANSRLLSATSASFDTKSSSMVERPATSMSQVSYIPKSSKIQIASASSIDPAAQQDGRASSLSVYKSSSASPIINSISFDLRSPPTPVSPASRTLSTPPLTDRTQHAALYNKLLASRTLALAAQSSNPAVDLVICLEKRHPIGFSYTDVVRHQSIIITHSRLDDRVPLTNIRWLQDVMTNASKSSGSRGTCELRVLDDESHGLMGSAKVMSSILEEMGREAVQILKDLREHPPSQNEKHERGFGSSRSGAGVGGGRERKDRRRQAVLGVKELVERSDQERERERARQYELEDKLMAETSFCGSMLY